MMETESLSMSSATSDNEKQPGVAASVAATAAFCQGLDRILNDAPEDQSGAVAVVAHSKSVRVVCSAASRFVLERLLLVDDNNNNRTREGGGLARAAAEALRILKLIAKNPAQNRDVGGGVVVVVPCDDYYDERHEAVLDSLAAFSATQQHREDVYPPLLTLFCDLILHDGGGRWFAKTTTTLPPFLDDDCYNCPTQLPDLHALRRMMVRHAGDIVMQRAALGFIVRLEYNNNPSSPLDARIRQHKEHVAQVFLRSGVGGGFHVYTRAMRQFSDDLDIQRDALTAIHSFSKTDASFVDKLLFQEFDNDRGCEVVISAMRNFPQSAEVQMRGCQVLSSNLLANKNKKKGDDSRQQDESVLQAIANALRNHPADPCVQQVALDLWAMMVEYKPGCRFPPRGNQELGLLLHAMHHHCSHIVLMAGVAVLDCYLCADLTRTCHGIMECQGIPTLLLALSFAAISAPPSKCSLDRDAWYRKICRVLASLLAENPEAAASSIARNDGGIALVCQLLLRAGSFLLPKKRGGDRDHKSDGLSEALQTLARSCSSCGEFPLHCLVSIHENSPLAWRQMQTVRCLLSEYPDACALPTKSGKLPLHLAIEGKASLQVVNTLLDANVQAALVRDGQGKFPLQVAIEQKAKFELIRTLVEADPTTGKEVCRSSGLPPTLMAAAADCDLSSIFFLICNDPSSVFPIAKKGQNYPSTESRRNCGSSHEKITLQNCKRRRVCSAT